MTQRFGHRIGPRLQTQVIRLIQWGPIGISALSVWATEVPETGNTHMPKYLMNWQETVTKFVLCWREITLNRLLNLVQHYQLKPTTTSPTQLGQMKSTINFTEILIIHFNGFQ